MVFSVSTDQVASTFGYHPLDTDFNVLVSYGFNRILVIGPTPIVAPHLAEAVRQVREVRLLPSNTAGLNRGLYWFHGAAGRDLLVVTAGSPASAASTPIAGLAADNPLYRAYGWFAHLWDQARPLSRPEYALRDEVITVPEGDPARVVAVSLAKGTWTYKIHVNGATRTVTAGAIIHPPTVGGPEEWITTEPAPAQRFAATLTRAKITNAFTDTVFSFRASRTIFRAYQFKPVLRVLETGTSRLLIADEVGLGKTIEAGLLWTELQARRSADRVLVICPPALIPKWQQEMRERFDFDLKELDAKALEEFWTALIQGRLPSRFAYVASSSRMRSWKRLSEVADRLRQPLDLIIVDEAHSMRNSTTATHAMGRVLSEISETLVFLTATPVNLGSQDLFNLLDLLVPGELGDAKSFQFQLEPNGVLGELERSLFNRALSASDREGILAKLDGLALGSTVTMRPEFKELVQAVRSDPLTYADVARSRMLVQELKSHSTVITRNRKAEVSDKRVVREPHPVEIEWEPVEASFYSEYLRWCRARAEDLNTPLGFGLQMPLRLASSCLPAAAANVLKWTSGPLSPRSDDDTWDADERRANERVPPHVELLQAARELGGTDTKFDKLLESLHDIAEQHRRALLFTYSRDTVDYLSRRLGGMFRIAELHGGVSKDKRHDIMTRFRNGEFDVVLATRVASEGLDFEFCSVVINYDLPWNPMEIEQRIGRLDRIGQESEKIIIVNFVNLETIDGRILDRVLNRIAVFKDSIGELEPIIEDNWPALKRAAFDFSLDEVQREHATDVVLAAIETQAAQHKALEEATDYLLSADALAIDGMESDLERSGRYVGQMEIVNMLRDWAATVGGGRVTVAEGGQTANFRGTPAMADVVRQASPEGLTEAHRVVESLRNEQDLHLSLDQGHSRTSGVPLLTTNHPLAQAALQVKGFQESRFARLRIPANSATPAGNFVVVLAVARWQGLRPSREVWHAAVDLATGQEIGEVGDALMASLAEGVLADWPPTPDAAPPAELQQGVRLAQAYLDERFVDEEARRTELDRALVDARRVTAEEVFTRRMKRLEELLIETDNPIRTRMLDGQRRRAHQRHKDTLEELTALDPNLTLEPIAVAFVEVLA